MFDFIILTHRAKKMFSKRDIILIFILIIFYFLTRVINLGHFPIFSDEGIYIHWAKVAWHDASWRFISLTDGRQPLQTWATIPFLKLFPDNALFAGRLFGVFSGLLGLFGIFTLSFYLFGKRTAYISSLLYIITPFFLFFDRLAMIDSVVNAGYIWIFFFSLLLVNTMRFDVALMFGFFSGMFLLAKSSVSIFLGLSLCAPLVGFKKNAQKNYRTIINYGILYGVVVMLALLIYNIQRLSPFFHFVGEKNHTFVKTWGEFIRAPFSVVSHNIRYTPLHIMHNLGYASFFLGIVGWFLIYKKNKLLAWYFLIWIFFPFIVITFFMKVLYSRYIIFLFSPFIIFTGYLLAFVLFQESENHDRKIVDEVMRSRMRYGLLALVFLFTFYFNYTIIFDYKKIPFLSDDRGQYIEGMPSGYGMDKILEYVRLRSSEKPSIIVASGNFGMAGDVLDTFLKPGDKIGIQAYWPLKDEDLVKSQDLLATHNVYVVSAHIDKIPSTWPVRLIQKYDKPGNLSSTYFFELKGNN